MCPVVPSATAIKVKSKDQAHWQASIKGSRQNLGQKYNQNREISYRLVQTGTTLSYSTLLYFGLYRDLEPSPLHARVRRGLGTLHSMHITGVSQRKLDRKRIMHIFSSNECSNCRTLWFLKAKITNTEFRSICKLFHVLYSYQWRVRVHISRRSKFLIAVRDGSTGYIAVTTPCINSSTKPQSFAAPQVFLGQLAHVPSGDDEGNS